jgi:hypothetical protein
VNRGGWSIWRQTGVSAAKARMSRRVGFPLWSRQAQDAWLGRQVVRLLAGLLAGLLGGRRRG